MQLRIAATINMMRKDVFAVVFALKIVQQKYLNLQLRMKPKTYNHDLAYNKIIRG